MEGLSATIWLLLTRGKPHDVIYNLFVLNDGGTRLLLEYLGNYLGVPMEVLEILRPHNVSHVGLVGPTTESRKVVSARDVGDREAARDAPWIFHRVDVEMEVVSSGGG